MKTLRIVIPAMALGLIGLVAMSPTGHTFANHLIIGVTCGDETDRVRIGVADNVIFENYTAKNVMDGTVKKADLDLEQAHIDELRQKAKTKLRGDTCQRYVIYDLIDARQQELDNARTYL